MFRECHKRKLKVQNVATRAQLPDTIEKFSIGIFPRLQSKCDFRQVKCFSIWTNIFSLMWCNCVDYHQNIFIILTVNVYFMWNKSHALHSNWKLCCVFYISSDWAQNANKSWELSLGVCIELENTTMDRMHQCTHMLNSSIFSLCYNIMRHVS